MLFFSKASPVQQHDVGFFVFPKKKRTKTSNKSTQQTNNQKGKKNTRDSSSCDLVLRRDPWLYDLFRATNPPGGASKESIIRFVCFINGTCAVVSRPAMRKFKTRSLGRRFGRTRVEFNHQKQDHEHRENAGTLGWYPFFRPPLLEPFKRGYI